MREFTDQELSRRNKLNDIAAITNPYPEKFDVTNTLLEARNLEDGTKGVRIAGRLVFARKMGKLSFGRIRDIESDIQIQLKSDVTNESDYDFFKKLVDIGDFIGAEGEIYAAYVLLF